MFKHTIRRIIFSESAIRFTTGSTRNSLRAASAVTATLPPDSAGGDWDESVPYAAEEHQQTEPRRRREPPEQVASAATPPPLSSNSAADWDESVPYDTEQHQQTEPRRRREPPEQVASAATPPPLSSKHHQQTEPLRLSALIAQYTKQAAEKNRASALECDPSTVPSDFFLDESWDQQAAEDEEPAAPRHRDFSLPEQQRAYMLDNSNTIDDIFQLRNEEQANGREDSPSTIAASTVPTGKHSGLSLKQQEVLRSVVVDKRSAFITGPGGCGKSHVLKEIIDTLPREGTHVTGSTGVAALNVGGITVHSFAGVGLAAGSFEDVVKKALNQPKTVRRWQECKVLIIDEISMIEKRLFAILDTIGRRARGELNVPFGGIQIVCCGDFLQLAPVKGNYCFESESWREANMMVHALSQNFRQTEDGFFRQMLSEIRTGIVTKQTLAALQARQVASQAEKLSKRRKDKRNGKPTIDALILRSTNAEVLKENWKRFHKLDPETDEDDSLFDSEQLEHLMNCGPRPLAVYFAADFWHCKKFKGKISDQRFRSSEVLSLKVGTQVMLQRNISAANGLINGATGTVCGFLKVRDLIEMRILHAYLFRKELHDLHNGTRDEHIPFGDKRYQFLLEKAGLSRRADVLAVMLSPTGNNGRIRPLFAKRAPKELKWLHRVDISVDDFDPSRPVVQITFENASRMTGFLNKFSAVKPHALMCPLDVAVPFVEYVDIQQQQKQQRMIVAFAPLAEVVHDGNEGKVVTRVQLPLQHAWAITVHKAQGKTISAINLDMKKFFNNGQAYSALSRAPSLDAIILRNVDASRFKTCSKALQFYEAVLESPPALPEDEADRPFKAMGGEAAAVFVPAKQEGLGDDDEVRRECTPWIRRTVKVKKAAAVEDKTDLGSCAVTAAMIRHMDLADENKRKEEADKVAAKRGARASQTESKKKIADRKDELNVLDLVKPPPSSPADSSSPIPEDSWLAPAEFPLW